MAERHGEVTFQGKPLTLTGEPVREGQKAPDFTAVTTDLEEFRLSDLGGKAALIVAVPSLDTSVCNIEARRFNEQADQIENTEVITISMDLPFAQARWREEAGTDKLQLLSDHRDAAFGASYGVLIKELRLLARSIFVVDSDGVIRYTQLVNEVTDEPDYDAALQAARSLNT